MLEGIDPLLTGELLLHLDRMGHSDAIVVADAHFPAWVVGTRVVDLPGTTTPQVVAAVRLYASVLGQPDDESRLAASRAIYSQLEQELQLKPSVTTGTVAGIVETRWGDDVDILTAGDASVVLWNGGTGAVATTYDLGDAREEGDVVGSLTVTGPLDDATVDLLLAEEVPDPSPWWRLTHPLDLFGLND